MFFLQSGAEEEKTVLSYRAQMRYVLVLLSRGEVDGAKECMDSVMGENTIDAMLSCDYRRQ